jgi:hypothetical protein
MSVNSQQTPVRPLQLMAVSVIAPLIRRRIYRFAAAGRSSRMFWRKWEPLLRLLLTHPITWSLAALIVSSVGLYWDRR